MEQVQIRAAEKADIEWINQQYQEVDFVPSIFEKEVIGIAEYEGQKAGIGRLVTIDDRNAELGGMYVFEAFRGKGIAKELVKFLLDQAHHFQTVYCIPFEYLASFYMHYGFAPCSNLEKVPRDVAAKYQWCKQQYPQPTALLFLHKVPSAP
ncbi:MAG TPA: GNAT family N-acetyltransferase [Rhabdochlamydiaceae bacterium]|nr:GNAT family N-acetyltransferase [Rhabdochlamydiaceae bacterium]